MQELVQLKMVHKMLRFVKCREIWSMPSSHPMQTSPRFAQAPQVLTSPARR